MVSLKSFKQINEAELDTLDDAQQIQQELGYPELSHHEHNPKQPQSSLAKIVDKLETQVSVNIENLSQTQETLPTKADAAVNILESNNNNRILNDQNKNIPTLISAKKSLINAMEQVKSSGGESQNGLAKSEKIQPQAPEIQQENGRAIVAVTLTPNTNSSVGEEDKRCQAIKSNDHNNLKLPVSTSSSSISIVVVRHDNVTEQYTSSVAPTTIANNENCSNKRNTEIDGQCIADNASSNSDSHQCSACEQTVDDGADRTSSKTLPSVEFCNDLPNVTSTNVYQENLLAYSTKVSAQQQFPVPPDHAISESRLSVDTESDHFEIVWSNLSYGIEPKWHKKYNYVDRVLSYFMPGQTIDSHSSATSTASSSAGMNDNQHQMHSSAHTDGHLGPAPRQKSLSDPIEIFTNLNGTIKSGQMTAVLGPSGAGKTTLLNCLTGKLRKGVSGHINLKGANGKHLKMCTIPQKDHLLEQLTVEENLWFASKIKNPELGFDHVKNIERVIDLLGLKRCRSAKIKKISGGQHKRVSIAQELLSNPDILVLDEPTSGLDSLTCFKTISMLRDLVELSANNDFMKPMAIIVTIHQPQPKVFNLFHHVYILANGGRVIYEGSPERSVETITEVTGLHPIDSAKPSSLSCGAIDPASFLIEIASEEYGVEVINTLSKYQRRRFHKNLEHRASLKEAEISGAKVNHAFSPEFEQEKHSDHISPMFVDGTPDTGLTDVEDSSNGSPSSVRQRSANDSKKTVPKTKRRRKSCAYKIDNSDNCSKSESSHNGDGSGSQDPNLYLSEQLLYTRVPNHKGRFWSHTATLTHRTLLTIRRDPLLMTSRVLFHLMIPILMGHVYGKATGAANACPHYEPEIDITQIPTLVESKRIEFMLEELHMSIENVSMFFIIMYAFAAAVLALNALSFPLNMQVLLKETRNGWYSMSSYVLAKTLADLPLELTMPCMTMLLVYPLTGQPSSYLQWRMLTICLIMTLCSLIAQTQALILGALVMNSVQTAVFVSQASQLPWVILAGFTIRIKRLSEPLKVISLTSFYRLGCEAITLTRYGFGICPCNPQEITGQPVRLVGIPDQLRNVAQYWIDSVEAGKAAAANESLDSFGGEDSTVSSLITTTLAPTTVANPQTTPKTDIFQHLANQLSYANSYGVNITSCDDVAPDRIRAINLTDNWLVARIWHLIIMLIIMKILLYYAVRFSIGIRL